MYNIIAVCGLPKSTSPNLATLNSLLSQEIEQYQQIAYDFEYVDHIAAFLRELPQNNDIDMWELSKSYEPKGGASVSPGPLLPAYLHMSYLATTGAAKQHIA